jgi:transcriptional regulator with XRE-family HTH domain
VPLNDIEDLNDNFINNFYIAVGKSVAKLRKSKKISQMELSQLLGHKSTSQVAGSEICYKNYHFNLEQLVKIAYIFDIDFKDLFLNIDIHSINQK